MWIVRFNFSSHEIEMVHTVCCVVFDFRVSSLDAYLLIANEIKLDESTVDPRPYQSINQ